MPRAKPILIVDTRERTPWDFEGDQDFADVKYQKLDQGDYALEGMEDVCVIERKASGDELLNNFFKSKERFIAEMQRLQPCVCPAIVVEQTLAELRSPDTYYINTSGRNRRSKYMPPAVVLDNLADIMIQYGVHVIFGGDNAKSIAKRILLRAWALRHQNKI
jgi:ERCC4-type nuclease